MINLTSFLKSLYVHLYYVTYIGKATQNVEIGVVLDGQLSPMIIGNVTIW